jgi:hypothetical protein
LIALRSLLDRLGPAGVISLGVLLFCAYFHFSAVRPLEHELAAQRSAAERLKTRSPVDIATAPDKADEARRFYELFPPMSQLPGQLERVYSIAREAGLTIQQGEYRLESRGAGLLSYRLAFPMKGTYPQIRRFVGTTLKDMPVASIDALRFERKRVGETQLEGQVRLTIYFRREGEDEIVGSGSVSQGSPPPMPRPALSAPERAPQPPGQESAPARKEPEL